MMKHVFMHQQFRFQKMAKNYLLLINDQSIPGSTLVPQIQKKY